MWLHFWRRTGRIGNDIFFDGTESCTYWLSRASQGNEVGGCCINFESGGELGETIPETIPPLPSLKYA